MRFAICLTILLAIAQPNCAAGTVTGYMVHVVDDGVVLDIFGGPPFFVIDQSIPKAEIFDRYDCVLNFSGEIQLNITSASWGGSTTPTPPLMPLFVSTFTGSFEPENGYTYYLPSGDFSAAPLTLDLSSDGSILLQTQSNTALGSARIDFTAVGVPEPSSILLFACGIPGVLVCVCRVWITSRRYTSSTAGHLTDRL
jgi:hypothetical protein